MKRYVKCSDEKIDEFLQEFAYETCDLDEEFDETEFSEFKKVCKENGYNVTKKDFKIYLDYVRDIRGDEDAIDDSSNDSSLEQRYEQFVKELARDTYPRKLSLLDFFKVGEENGFGDIMYYKDYTDCFEDMQ